MCYVRRPSLVIILVLLWRPSFLSLSVFLNSKFKLVLPQGKYTEVYRWALTFFVYEWVHMVEMLAGVPKIVLNVRSSVLIMQFLKI